MGISLPRPLSNTDSCLIPIDSGRCRMPVNLAPLHFLIPSLGQRPSFADFSDVRRRNALSPETLAFKLRELR
jgi:hypothetical protein